VPIHLLLEDLIGGTMLAHKKIYCKNGHLLNEKGKCPTCLRAAHHRWREAHPEREREVRRNTYNKNKPARRKHARAKRYALKVEVLTHYGPKGALRCCWEGCAVCDVDMLSLDHMNNNGASERKELYGTNKGIQGGSTRVYARVKREGFPLGFQTLCMNHQWKKEITRLRDTWLD
jgi:hypothetical protein